MAQERDPAVARPDVTRASALAHLYGAMYCLVLLGESGGNGAVTRAARAGQAELWPAIAYLGGGTHAFADWHEAHERRTDGYTGAG